MIRFIPSVVLGVYAVVTFALGDGMVSICSLALASALVISDQHVSRKDGYEALWSELKDQRNNQAALYREFQKCLNDLQALSSQNAAVKERLGVLVGEMSKFQKSDDPWSGQ